MKNTKPLLKAVALLGGALLLTNAAAAAPKTWAVSGVDTNWSTVNNWSPVGAPSTGDDVIFSLVGATAYVANSIPATNNVVDLAFTAMPNSLSYNQTNLSHGTLISGSGLVISGTAATPNPLFVGSGVDNGDYGANDVVAIWGTSLAITNPNSPIIIQETGSASVGRRATLNLSGLNTFTAKVQQLAIAYDYDGLTIHRRPCGTLYLAKTNYITCTASGTPAPGSDTGIGYMLAEVEQNNGNASTNLLGQVNVFNVNAMKFGGAKTGNSYVGFNSGWVSPSVTFRNAAGTGPQTAWFIGDDSTTASSSNNSSAIVDLSGGTVDALVGTIYVGLGQSANTLYLKGGIGTLIFNQGTINVNTLELGYQVAAGTSTGQGTVTVKTNGLLTVTNNIRLAYNLGSGGGSLVTNSIGNLNINGGTVQVYGNVVDGGGFSTLTITNNGTLNMKPAGRTIAGNVAVRVLNIGAGVLTNYGTLNVSNLNVLSPASQFTVYPGQALGAVGAGLVGTLTVNTNLVLTNATLSLDLGTPGGANDQIAVSANLSLLGTNSVLINPLSGFGPGGYPIVTYGAGLTGNVANNLNVGGAMADSRYSLYFDTTTAANTITLNVSGGPAANLAWSGDGLGNIWDLHQTSNWNDGGGAKDAKFYNLDTVTFDDTGSASPAVSLAGALLPTSVTVNGTKSYTMSGSGKISGSAGLTYNSTGTLTLLTTNDYTGTTVINSGTVQVGDGITADGGIGSYEIDNYGALVFNSASFQSVPGVITGTGPITKLGPGVTQLSGLNTFSAPITNAEGTLMAGSGSAFGGTGATINSGATLDLGGQNIGGVQVYASGTGVGGAGAIINSGPTAGVIAGLSLLGPTTFGGSASWVIGPVGGLSLQANSNKVTKVGTSSVQFYNGDETFIADAGFGGVEIQAGTLSLYGYVSLGDPNGTITVRSNATLQVVNTGDSLTVKQIAMNGGSTEILSELPIFDSDLRRIGDKSAQKCLYLLVF